jgi:effector-binding domain-containing protein
MRTLFIVVMALVLSVSVLCSQTPPQPTEPPKAPAPTTVPDVAKAPDAPPASVKAILLGEIAVKTIPATLAACVSEKASAYEPQGGYKAGMEGIGDAYKTMMMNGYGKLGVWMKAGGKVKGPSLAFYYEDPSKTAAKDLTCKLCFPTDTGAKGSDIVMVANLPEEKCAVAQYKGPYESSDYIWNAVDKWIAAHNLVTAGAPSEVYLKGPSDNVPPAEFITEIRIPVKPVEPKKESPKK